MAERSHDQSSSAESQPKFPGCSHFRRRNDNHYRCQQCWLNEGLTLCTQDRPCSACKDWLPEAWEAQAKANAKKTRRKAAAAAKAVKKASERETMDDSVEIHAPEETLQLPSKRASSDGSSKSKQTKTKATSSGSREPKSVVSSVSEVGRLSSDGPDRHRSRSSDRKRRHGADKCQDSPRHQSSRRDSGRREGERSRPSSSGGSSSRRRAESSSVSKASDTRPSASSSHHRHHQSSGDQRSLSSFSSRASPDHKSPPSRERRRESADRTGPSYVARQEVQLSPKIVKPPEKRTITVISSPARQVQVDVPAPVTGPAQVTDGPVGAGPATVDGPDTVDGLATVDGPASEGPAGDGPASDGPADGPATVDSSDSSALQFDDPAESDGPTRHPAAGVDGSAGHRTPAGSTPVGGPDASVLTGTSSPLFPSIPTSINQAMLIDFMSIWTLLQRWMDQGMVPDTPASPAVQSSVPAPRHDSTPRRSDTMSRTPERRPRTPEPRTPQRSPRMPVRRVRTPVRQARGYNDSRESRSRSPLSRSSSVESPTRDVSPVNFSAALDPDDKRSISDDEDDEGEHKISAAQYQIFRQAVTTSKGSFKVNPAKTKQASRASLLDLGGPEVTDRVSWLDQPSLQHTMVSTARIAQGLKDDEEVEKTTLSETLNTASSTFKVFTVKQIFPREPYRLKVHRDALYVPKSPGDHGFRDNKAPSSYQVSHRMCLDTEELAQRSTIYASLADSMVASVIEKLSPKDKRSKLLREKLAIIQKAQVSAVSAGCAAASNLQLLCRDALLKNFGFQPQVLSSVRTAPFEGITMWWVPNQRSFKTVYVPSGKLTGWLARLWLSPRSIESPRPARKWRHPRRRLLELQSLTAWGPRPPRLRGLWRRSRPFELALAGSASGKCARSLARLLRLPQPDNIDGSQVGAHLADFAPHWRSLLGNCWATGIVEDGVGIAFQQRPQLTHQSISFKTRNSCQDLQQAVDALLMKGAIERVTNVMSLGFYSQLFLVPKKTGDLRPVIDLSTFNRHIVVPHFKMETQWSVPSAIRSQEWTVSIDIPDAYLHVLMHQAVRKYLRFVVNKKVYQFTCLPFGLTTSPREFTKMLRPIVSLLRQQGVKLHVYFRRLADQGRYPGTGSTARPDNHQGAPVSWLDHQLREVRSHTKSRLPVHRDAVQHSTFHSGAPTEDASKGPVSSSALDDRSEHQGQRFAQTSWHVGVHGFAGPARTAPSSSGPMVGRHSMVPEDRELVRPDLSSTVGSVRDGMVVISSSPARSTPRHQGDGSNSLHR